MTIYTDGPRPPTITASVPGGRATFPHLALARQRPRVLASSAWLTSSGKAFVWLDRQLDAMHRGPRYLSRPEIARVVIGCIHKGEQIGHYEIGAYVVMANHVHLLIRPAVAPEHLLAVAQGRQRALRESGVGTQRRAVLAKGILRSLGAGPSRVRAHPGLHRGQSSQGRIGCYAAGFPLVERKRREKSRRGTHECVRHGADLTPLRRSRRIHGLWSCRLAE